MEYDLIYDIEVLSAREEVLIVLYEGDVYEVPWVVIHPSQRGMVCAAGDIINPLRVTQEFADSTWPIPD